MRRTVVSLMALALVAAGPAAAADAAAKKPTSSKRGPRGPRGPQGPAGATGPQGTPGIAGIRVQFVDGPVVPMCVYQGDASCAVGTSEAKCPAGMIAIGGGFSIGAIGTEVSYSASSITSWVVVAVNTGTSPSTVQANAVCMTNVGAAPA